MIEFIPPVLSLTGIAGILYGLYNIRKLRDMMETGQLKEAFIVPMALMTTVMLGALAYFASLTGIVADIALSTTLDLVLSSGILLAGLMIGIFTRLNVKIFRT